jgi:hypothetical protein
VSDQQEVHRRPAHRLAADPDLAQEAGQAGPRETDAALLSVDP